MEKLAEATASKTEKANESDEEEWDEGAEEEYGGWVKTKKVGPAKPTLYEDMMRGYKLLRASGLSRQERNSILSVTGNRTDYDLVASTMRAQFDPEDGNQQNRTGRVWTHDTYFDDYDEGWNEAYYEDSTWADDGWTYYEDEIYYEAEEWDEGWQETAEDPELAEALWVRDEAARTLAQARQAVAAARSARGFWTPGKGQPSKGRAPGKGKGKGKGKRKGKVHYEEEQTTTVEEEATADDGDLFANQADPPCVACGGNHPYQRCPENYSVAVPKGKGKGKHRKGGKGKGKGKAKVHFQYAITEVCYGEPDSEALTRLRAAQQRIMLDLPRPPPPVIVPPGWESPEEPEDNPWQNLVDVPPPPPPFTYEDEQRYQDPPPPPDPGGQRPKTCLLYTSPSPRD